MIPLQVVSTILFALLFSTCDQPNGPGKYPFLELTAENVISKEVWLRVRFLNTAGPLDFVLERNGSQIAVGKIRTVGKADTLVIDATVSPGTTYRYKAIQLEGTARTMESDLVQVTTLDTTSHQVQWQVDTVGIRGTIFDVWAFSQNSIWAVGEIYLKDSTGKEDPVKYNLARWDGQRWAIMRVYYEQSLLTFRAIYAFGQNDVWVGGNTQPMHWNGSQWQKYDVPATVFSAYIYKMWGTSSSNMIIVGTTGSIARFNGTTWQKMQSGTTVDLEDVWGIDESHVWATGTKTDLSRGIILQYDGRNWSTIYDSFGQPGDRAFGFSSVWTNNGSVLFLAGASGRWSFNLEDRIFRDLEQIGTWQSYDIRGTGQNDLFVGSAAGEALHYNGSSWYLYPELQHSGGTAFALWHTIDPAKDFVVIGGEFFTGLNGVPVVVRGYR